MGTAIDVPGSASGRVAQVVNFETGAVATGTTTTPADDTIPQITEGNEFLSATITPTNASNKLRIDIVVNIATAAGANLLLMIALHQDSTADALAAVKTSTASPNNYVNEFGYTHYMTAGTTSATTFKVRVGSSTAGTLTLNGEAGVREMGGVFASSITITEVGPEVLPVTVYSGGNIRQIVNVQDGALSTGTTIIPDDDSIPQNTEGDEFMTLAVTPTSATNKLKIDVAFFGATSSGGIMCAALFQDSAAASLSAGRSDETAGNNAMESIAFSYYMTAGTTSAITFKVRGGGVGGTHTFNGKSAARKLGGVMASSITITEIGPQV